MTAYITTVTGGVNVVPSPAVAEILKEQEASLQKNRILTTKLFGIRLEKILKDAIKLLPKAAEDEIIELLALLQKTDVWQRRNFPMPENSSALDLMNTIILILFSIYLWLKLFLC